MEQVRDVVDDVELDKKVFKALLHYGNQSATLLSIAVGCGVAEVLLSLKRLKARKAIRWAKTLQALPAPS